jgi:surface antigen
MRPLPRLRRLAATAALVALGSGFLAVAGPPAGASTVDCTSKGYDCTPGYTGANASGTWAWKYYGGSFAQTVNGYHNCTLYAAWKLEQAGMPDPGRSFGNASEWASRLADGDHTPTVGAIAWWGSEIGGGFGHVAYVAQVSGNQVYVTADNHTGGTSAGWTSASSVDLFLHPFDATPDDDPTATAPVHDFSFVKTQNAASGHVEAFTASLESTYTTGVSAATRFGAADGANGSFGMLPDGDVSFVKTRSAGSGRIEGFTATQSSGYRSGVSAATRFGAVDGANGSFGMLGDGDVWFVKTRNAASGRIEAFTATATSGYGSGLSTATRFGAGDGDNGTWGVLPNGDLWFVKTRNAASGRIEAFTATAASGYRSGVSAATRFPAAAAATGVFGMLPNGDIYWAQTIGTSGQIEFSTATATSGYQSGASAATTRFGTFDAGNGTFALLS